MRATCLRRAVTVAGLSTVVFGAAGCEDLLGPGEGGLPGRRILRTGEYTTSWQWVDGDRILYGTPFDYAPGAPGPRLALLDVDGGHETTVASIQGTGYIVSTRFWIRDGYVYFEVSTGTDHVGLYRAPLGGGAVELVLDSVPYGPAVSYDGEQVAWIDMSRMPRSIVVTQVATGDTAEYELAHTPQHLVWSPDGTGLVAYTEGSWDAAGTPYEWLDLETGVVVAWLAPATVTDERHTEVAWTDGTPWLYVSGAGVFRYAIGSGAAHGFSGAAGHAAGWSDDRSVVALVQHDCLEWSDGPFGGACLRWRTTIDRLDVVTDRIERVVRHEGGSQLFPRLSPDGNRIVYEHPDAGLYVIDL